MRIAVIGAGWYGCHIASDLITKGADVDIFETKKDIFMCASGYNQNRLHLGFHYPRSYVTREQSREGFRLFMSKYPDFTEPINDNVFAVALKYSSIDFETYRQIMKATNLDFENCNPEDFNLKNVSGAIKCYERLIATDKAKAYFKTSLENHLHLDTPVKELQPTAHGVRLDSSFYNFVVNCTWATFQPPEGLDLYYQPCVSLVYEGDPNHPAITIMDGPFMSVYPYKENLFIVTSVKETPRQSFQTFSLAQIYMQTIDSDYISKIKKRIEAEVKIYYPTFLDQFKYAGFFTSMKTKINDSTEKRDCIVKKKGRIVQVISGKVNTIFFASDEVLKCLGYPWEKPHDI